VAATGGGTTQSAPSLLEYLFLSLLLPDNKIRIIHYAARLLRDVFNFIRP